MKATSKETRKVCWKGQEAGWTSSPTEDSYQNKSNQE